MNILLLALLTMIGTACETIANILPSIDPAQVPSDDLKKLLCEIHAAGLAIEVFRERAKQVVTFTPEEIPVVIITPTKNPSHGNNN